MNDALYVLPAECLMVSNTSRTIFDTPLSLNLPIVNLTIPQTALLALNDQVGAIAHCHPIVRLWLRPSDSGQTEFAAYVTLRFPRFVTLPILNGTNVYCVERDAGRISLRPILEDIGCGLLDVDRLMIGNEADFPPDTAEMFRSVWERARVVLVSLGYPDEHGHGAMVPDGRWVFQVNHLEWRPFPGQAVYAVAMLDQSHDPTDAASS